MEREDRFYAGLKKFLLIAGVFILLYLLNTWQSGETKTISLILKNAKLQIFSIVMLAILLEAFPFLLFGALISAFIEVFVSKETLTRFIPANKFLAPATGALLGIIFPVCSCANVPVARRLLKRGLPTTVVVSYMLATPIINPLVIISTAVAFAGSKRMLLGRVGFAFFVAIIIAYLISAITKGKPILKEKNPEAPIYEPSFSKVERVFWHTESDFLKMGKYLIFGAFAAALFQTFISRPAMLKLANNNFSAIGLMESLAIILSLCSLTDAFVANTFTKFTTISKLTFLVAGPMANLSLIIMYLGIFKREFVVKLIPSVIVLVFIIAYVISSIWG